MSAGTAGLGPGRARTLKDKRRALGEGKMQTESAVCKTQDFKVKMEETLDLTTPEGPQSTSLKESLASVFESRSKKRYRRGEVKAGATGKSEKK